MDNKCPDFRAGCITKSISNWQMITSDKEILTSVQVSAIIDNEVAKLLSKNIIETTDHETNEVISNIFIRPKKDRGHRLILNFKGLNQFFHLSPF